MKPDIIIPSNKPEWKLRKQIKAICETSPGCRVIPTCFDTSAATNRNWGLNHACDIVVMVDDDIWGYFPGWAAMLAAPLADPGVVMVSARLMKTKTKPGVMMNIRLDLSADIVEVPDQVLPSACIAIRNDGTRFDEAYLGAGFEDTDYCMQLNEKYPEGRYLIRNDVKMIHRNEMKGQQDWRFMNNRTRYMRKWGFE